MIVKVEKLVYNGYGLARAPEGRVLFIPYTAPQEKVKVRIVEERKDFAFAKVVEILEPSPYRVEPSCPHFGLCGSCQWLHVNYEEQLRQKRQILERELTKQLKRKVNIEEIIPSYPFGYRRRAKLYVERKLIGFKSFRGIKVIPIGRCLLLTEALNSALLELYKYQSVLRNATEIWMGSDKDENTVLVSMNASKKIRDIHSILHSIEEKTQKEAGVLIRYSTKRSQLGRRFLLETLMGKRIKYTYNSFFQNNRFLTERLVEEVVKRVEEGARVLELYSGCGTFTLPVASKAKEITAVEMNPTSCQLLRESAAENQLNNVKVIEAECSRFISSLEERFDIVLLDPPREGCSIQIIQWINEKKPQRVIYVSCNPTTLAKDLSRINGYEIETMIPIDMFPQTFHIEAIAVLKRATPTQ